MMTYDEVMEAIEKGFIKGDKNQYCPTKWENP